MAAGDGLIVMQPTSVDVTGTSASINSDGGVDFTAATSLSLNGVFTSSFNNYLLSITYKNSAAGNHNQFRLRVSGTDNSTANSYVYQKLEATGSSTPTGTRTTSNLTLITRESGTDPSGDVVAIYGPFLAQATAMRTVDASSRLSAYITDLAATHNQATSYDGFTIFPDAGSITGNIVVFGYEE